MTLPAKERRRRQKALKKNPPKIGRPKKPINSLSLKELAALGCSDAEMARVLGIHPGTFSTRKQTDPEFREAIEAGQAEGRVSLRVLQKQHSEGEGGPAVNMTIYRSKHLLGEFDKPVETKSTVDINVDINSAGERLVAKLDDLRRRILGPAVGQEGVPLLTVVEAEYAEVSSRA